MNDTGLIGRTTLRPGPLSARLGLFGTPASLSEAEALSCEVLGLTPGTGSHLEPCGATAVGRFSVTEQRSDGEIQVDVAVCPKHAYRLHLPTSARLS